jgi:hypothetical protein
MVEFCFILNLYIRIIRDARDNSNSKIASSSKDGCNSRDVRDNSNGRTASSSKDGSNSRDHWAPAKGEGYLIV